MRKTLFTLAIAVLLGVQAYAQYDMNSPMPMDPDLKIGKLDNGLTYFIQHNEEPKDRADFYIIYKVGALQENENQNGLAHFLEHMAFNGSKNFPGGNSSSTSIVKTLERHGVAFGRNINAYTSLDRTVYYLNDVATGDSALIDTCLLVLHDWCHYLSLEAEEIDSERGVISEEWRTRNNSGSRMRKQWMPTIFGDTRYSTHDVIGSYDIINNFKYDELRDFYYQWYRTDMQAVAVVGDVDVADIEKRITAMFSSIPAVENPTPKEEIRLPENSEPGYVLATDPEQSSTEVEVIMTRPMVLEKTVGGQRYRILRDFYNTLLKQRIDEIVSNGDPDIVSGSGSLKEFIPGYEAYSISSTGYEGKEFPAFEKIYTEVVRAKRFGFTESELKRFKLDLISSLDAQYKKKDKVKNSTIADRIVQIFAYDKVHTNIEYFYPLMKDLVNGITLSDVNELAASLPYDMNVNIVIMAKAEEGRTYPGKDDILGIMAKVDADKSIKAYVDKVVGTGLVDKELAGGRIVKEKALPVFGAKQWTLSNGSTVVYAKADYDKNTVSLSSNSWGGASLYPAEELINVSCVSQAAASCGAGNYSAIDLKKVLAGKKADVSLNIKDESESISGTSTTEDFEAMMQLAYLRFAEPRFDSLCFYSGIDKMASILDMLNASPDMAVSDSLAKIRSGNNPRTISLNSKTIRQARLENVERIYRERFADASDFTFFIIGDVEEDVARAAAEKYIGSLPAAGHKEKFVDNHEDMVKGHTMRNVVIPFKTPKASVNLLYSGRHKLDRKTRQEMSVLRDVLNMRFVINVREKEGGTYGVKSQMSGKRLPKNTINYMIQFDTEIAKAAHLRELVLEEIENICTDGITEEELDNVRKNLLKNREQSKSNNGWVEQHVRDYVIYGENYSDPSNYEEVLKKLKPSDVQKFARKYFKSADMVDVIFANEF
ncbi:MAG: insulinase family protein [Bacteroidales bacterium]|nr:insulinase family protein [Bacteroidales bacterium]